MVKFRYYCAPANRVAAIRDNVFYVTTRLQLSRVSKVVTFTRSTTLQKKHGLRDREEKGSIKLIKIFTKCCLSFFLEKYRKCPRCFQDIMSTEDGQPTTKTSRLATVSHSFPLDLSLINEIIET